MLEHVLQRRQDLPIHTQPPNNKGQKMVNL